MDARGRKCNFEPWVAIGRDSDGNSHSLGLFFASLYRCILILLASNSRRSQPDTTNSLSSGSERANDENTSIL